MKLQVRMNVKTKSVELRTCEETEDIGALQKGADFVRAYTLGFDIEVPFFLKKNVLTKFNLGTGCHGPSSSR